MNPKRRLKNFLIWPKQQINHAAFTFGLIVLGNSVLTVFTIFYISDVFEVNNFEDLSVLKYDLISFIIIAFVAATLLSGLLAVFFNIMHTHRIFGSLFAIERHLRGLLENKDPKPISLRPNDQTGPIAELINQLAQKIK